MKTFTKADLLNMATAEKARLLEKIDSEGAKQACNDRKVLTACVNAEKILLAVGDKFTANAEVYTAGRETPIFNYGTVAEQALFYLRTRRATGKSDKDGYDHSLKGRKCEYKACLSHSSKNSPYTPNNAGKWADVLLVNAVGVWYIPAEDAQGLIDKYGRFNPTADYSEYMPEDMIDLCETLTAAIFG